MRLKQSNTSGGAPFGFAGLPGCGRVALGIMRGNAFRGARCAAMLGSEAFDGMCRGASHGFDSRSRTICELRFVAREILLTIGVGILMIPLKMMRTALSSRVFRDAGLK